MASSRKKPARTARRQAPVKKAPGGRKRKTVENDETCLQKHQKQFLDKSGLWSRLLIFHVANERKGGFGTQMHFKRMGVRPGVADWLVFRGVRRIAIENKDDEGTQEGDQERFQVQWEAAGGEYYLVRTLGEFQTIINGLMLF